ncbi:F-box/FBD/LRR-repeat protein At1g13570-like [Ipomoea triloba]|uniref:F-box/FBD/LRR-repeat protein At1g13570-like n=1 Tax=Ipomoea triloba TaxID=35885 RepID=UPI00125E0B34|nr:F-box/FBD/LRR-repeat protein At1g13570-like [Ipomoea triloba]
MATSPRLETTQHETRNLISELPTELKHRILECLPTRDAARMAILSTLWKNVAARMAILSTLWKNVWLQHGRLVFDKAFFRSIQNYIAENSTSALNIIYNILLLRRGPVKKFTLKIYLEPKLQQSDIEWGCHFLSRNGIEELTLLFLGSTLKLPACIFSCPTIKQLRLCCLIVDFPANARCIFPGVTSLVLNTVELNGVSATIPNLEKLAFLGGCEGMDKFEIIAPKLESLSHISAYSGFEPRWFALQLKRIKSLCLSGGSLMVRIESI